MNPNIPGRNPSPHSQEKPESFGLIAWLDETRLVLPLKAVDVSFSVSGDLAEIRLDQIFHQTARGPLDVLYSFPLPAGAAVFKCELIVNERVIQARVEEQGRAREIARAMKNAGHRTSLVEMERDNLFTLSLGNVQPDDLIVVRFAWFQVLDHSQNVKSLSIPFTPGVRYIPGKPLLRSNRGMGTSDDTNQVPDASRISPPRIDEFHPDAALISLQGKVDARFLDKDSVSSATHTLILRDEKEWLRITLPAQGHVPDRDFVLRWQGTVATSLELRSLACVDEEHQYAVLRLDAPVNVTAVSNPSRDYYFLIDRSGSMQGRKWTCTAQALRAFVGELDNADRVWITLFESDFQDFAEAPMTAADLRNDLAFKALEELGVDGGTELLPALEHVLQQVAVHSSGRNPVLLLITDGQVGNEDEIIEVLRPQAELPIHTFGIDTAVNDAFLKKVAAQHRGACVLMTPNDDIQGAVSRLGSRLRRPVLTKLEIPAEWQVASPGLSDLHAGEHAVIALRGPTQATFVELSGDAGDRDRRTFRFELKQDPMVAPRLLWARETIDQLLAENQRPKAIELAIKHNLICDGAAFIAYDLQEKVALSTQEIYQPVIMAAAPIFAAGVRPRIATKASGRIPPPSDVRERLIGYSAVPDLPIALEEATERLEEIRERYFGAEKRLNLRSQILLDKWKNEGRRIAPFNGPAGMLLQEFLCSWAGQDLAARLSLLNLLLKDLQGTGARVAMQNFIKFQIANPKMEEELLTAVNLLNQGVE